MDQNQNQGESKKEKPVIKYVPLHPELFTYGETFLKFLDPALRTIPSDPRTLVKENVEQIYQFQLFTPEFCRLLIEEAEHCGLWETKTQDYTSPHPSGQEGIIEEDAPDTCLSFKKMPPFVLLICVNDLTASVQALWRTFKIQKMDTPYLLKYEPHLISGMKLHYDLETVSMIIYLNHDFEGGGTYFPKWNFTVAKPPIGSAVVYPGGVSHEHEGLHITKGRRYLMLGCFY